VGFVGADQFLYINNKNFCVNFLLVVFRLVNISSHILGGLSQLSEELQKKFSSPSLAEEGLVKLMDQFLQYVNMNSNCGSSFKIIFFLSLHRVVCDECSAMTEWI